MTKTWAEYVTICKNGYAGTVLGEGRLAIVARKSIFDALYNKMVINQWSGINMVNIECFSCANIILFQNLWVFAVGLFQRNTTVEPSGNWYWTDTRYPNLDYPFVSVKDPLLFDVCVFKA
jgi:hypothetical protein